MSQLSSQAVSPANGQWNDTHCTLTSGKERKGNNEYTLTPTTCYFWPLKYTPQSHHAGTREQGSRHVALNNRNTEQFSALKTEMKT